MTWYVLLIGVVAVERLAEVVVANRNRAWSQSHGGVEFGARHYPAMVALHTGLLAGCLVEVIALHRPFVPALGWPMLAIVLAAQALRWWCIATLDGQWNTRVIVIPWRGPHHRWPVPVCVPPELRRSDRGRGCAAVGTHGVDHRAGVLAAQRGAADCADQGRKRCAVEPDVMDLLVVGGGPAGLATAIRGAQAGLEVAVVEQRSGPIDKACGEGLMPHTVRQLERLGVQARRQALPWDQLHQRRPASRRTIHVRHRTRRAQDRAALCTSRCGGQCGGANPSRTGV